MTLKDIQQLVVSQTESAEASQLLSRKMTFKALTLAVVSLLVLGLALVYTLKGYPTFTQEIQKIILIGLSVVFGLTAIVLLYTIQKMTNWRLSKQFNLFKWVDTLQFFMVCLLIVLHVITFYVFTAEVFQSSMYPTLTEHDRLIVYQFDYQPKRRDIVVIFMDETYYTQVDNAHYVKRVVGLPGDTIVLNAQNQLLINGELVQQVPAGYAASVSDLISTLSDSKIPDGFYFVLGDHVANSQDSRTLGLIREADIKAKVIFRFYPKVGFID